MVVSIVTRIHRAAARLARCGEERELLGSEFDAVNELDQPSGDMGEGDLSSVAPGGKNSGRR